MNFGKNTKLLVEKIVAKIFFHCNLIEINLFSRQARITVGSRGRYFDR